MIKNHNSLHNKPESVHILNSKHLTLEKAANALSIALSQHKSADESYVKSFSEFMQTLENGCSDAEVAQSSDDLIRASSKLHSTKLAIRSHVLDFEEAQFAELLRIDRILEKSDHKLHSDLADRKAQIIFDLKKGAAIRHALPRMNNSDILECGTIRQKHRLIYGKDLILPEEATPYLMYV